MKPLPDYDELHRLFCYNPETGFLICKTNGRNGQRKKGQIIGQISNSKRYIQLAINGNKYMLHHIAYKLMTKQNPPDGMVIDHIDNNKHNNRWSNLRICSQRNNCRNQSKTKLRKYDLPKGVTYVKSKGLYKCQLKIEDGKFYSKYFHTVEDAHNHYCELSKQYFGEYYNYG